MVDFSYSPEDEELIRAYRWAVNKDGYVRQTYAPKNEERFLHRMLLKPRPNQEVDRIDGNPSNNTRENLRICSRPQNAAARSMPVRVLPRGVYYDKRTNKYSAMVRFGGKLYWCGRHTTIEESQTARDNKAIAFFGESTKTGLG